MYKYCISLGYACFIASSMTKYGLRSCSGPFDWYGSEFRGVVDCLDNDFTDFFKYENLKSIEGNPKVLLDVKHGFRCPHEIDLCLEDEYPAIFDKYVRRVKRFRKMIKEPTLFIRGIESVEEINFIIQNTKRISSVLRRSNRQNRIIYLLPQELQEKDILLTNGGIEFYEVELLDASNFLVAESNFDSNMEFLSFCLHNVEPSTIVENMLQEPFRRRLPAEVQMRTLEITQMLLQVSLSGKHIQYKGRDDQTIIIYGAGLLGRQLYEVMHRSLKVCLFIDEYSTEKEYKTVPICKLTELEKYVNQKDIVIVVTPVKQSNKIVERVREAGYENIISVYDLLKENI